MVAHENNPEGNIQDIELEDTFDLLREATESVLVMSRKNKHLVKLATSLTRNQIGFTFRGRKFGNTIVKLVEEIMLGKHNKIKRGYSWSNFEDHLHDWYMRSMERLVNHGANSTTLALHEDKYESLCLLFDSYSESRTEPSSLKGFTTFIKSIFESASSKLIVLSSVHRAKGDEAHTTIIINRDEMPMKYKNQTPSEKEQENNILHVALTRCCGTDMYFLDLT